MALISLGVDGSQAWAQSEAGKHAPASENARGPQLSVGHPEAAPAEQVTVYGKRRRYTPAPVPEEPSLGYGQGRDAIRDTRTGADLSAFGDAFSSTSPMGSDERSNETGGPFTAPDHP